MLINILLWLGWMLIAGTVSMLAALAHFSKGKRQIVEDFFEYVQSGRRAPRLAEHAVAFIAMQSLYPAFMLFVPLWIYIIAAFACFYAYALSADRMKKTRHNGVPIGFEFPHPAEFKAAPIRMQGEEAKQALYFGSKGIYDIMVKSEPNPHIIAIGESGSGKTTAMQGFLARAYLLEHIPFLAIDWSGKYKDDLDVNVWMVPKNLKINPFKLNGMGAMQRASIASELMEFAFGLTSLQAQRIRHMLEGIYESSEPTIEGLQESLGNEIENERMPEIRVQLRYIQEKLEGAARIFGNEPDEFWDNYDSTCNIVDLHELSGSERKLATYAIIERIIEQFEGSSSIRLYIALDDAYEALKDYNGMETNITKVIREGRKYGFGIAIATQMLEDLPKAAVANAAIKIVLPYHDPYSVEKVYEMLGLSEIEMAIMHRMPKGYAFVFDEQALQRGSVHPAFMRILPLEGYEKERLAAQIKRLNVAGYALQERKEKAKGERKSSAYATMPDVSLYRFLVAVHRNKSANAAIKWLKERKLVVSNRTL
ncbi:MAG: DUF87 domain-containing protein, partial [Candidatus Micrarchaeaceae archaeon]